MNGRHLIIATITAVAAAMVGIGIAAAMSGSGSLSSLTPGAEPQSAFGTASTDGTQRSDDGDAERRDDGGEVPGLGEPPSGNEAELTPRSEATAPPAVESVPPPASRLGGRVGGFPDIIPLAPGSVIVSSSVNSDGGRVQATLDAEASASPEEVLASYRAQFADIAFHPAAAPSVGGSTALTFSRGADTVVVTVAASSTGGTRYSVFGVFAIVP